MDFSWQIINNDSTEVERFASQLNSSPILAQVLLNRGISDVDGARQFFLPKFQQLHDPFLMADMEKATGRIAEAVQQQQKIMIYGDYDVDGTTATSMLLLFFRGLDQPVDFYVPDRLTEGYGLSEQGIRHAHADGCQLLISVDCGITATSEVELANHLGIDVIICDHHEPGPNLPPAAAVLNPKRRDCSYPFKELAGVGVAFKLLQALQIHLKLDESILMSLLDLVAVGSSADIVPLIDENRILVKLGLANITRTENLGLRALLNSTGLQGQTIGVGQVVFVIAPRINAVGRMGDAGRAVRLLTADNPRTAANIASILESENRIRKDIDEETFAQALELVATKFDPSDQAVLVLDNEGWHPGVIGIVASRLVEKYFRPTVMIATENGQGKGSARSIPGFDIYQALKGCEDLMEEFGGHKYAAGLTIAVDKIPLLKERLAEVAAGTLTDDLLTPKLRIDAEMRFREIDGDLLKLLNKMSPFGPQNMRPVFLSHDLQVVGSPRVVGRNHLKFKVRQDGVVMDAIGFDLGDLMYRIASGEKHVDVVYALDENEWQGRKHLQLRVKDLR